MNSVAGRTGDGNVDGEGDGEGTKTWVEANEGTQHGNENGRRGTGSRREDEGRIYARKPRKVVDVMWETGETWAEVEKNTTQKY